MQQRLNLVTLGVSDIARARTFYEAWGWKASTASRPEVAFFQANGLALALWGREELSKDAGVDIIVGGFSPFALAYNTRSKTETDDVYARAIAAGGNALKPPREVFWGGYSGYFADPDMHLWEVTWNPDFFLDEQGHLSLPGPRP